MMGSSGGSNWAICIFFAVSAASGLVSSFSTSSVGHAPHFSVCRTRQEGITSLPSRRNIVSAGGQSMVASMSSTSSCEYDFALLFDCDGVILETEELHRLAYNAAFEAADLTIGGERVAWSVAYYDVLQNTVGGGKPKMFFHFRNTTGEFPSVGGEPAPTSPEAQQELVDKLQAHKTEIYRAYIEEKAVARPGVIELMDEALADPTIAVGVCSASTKEAVQKVLAVTLGADRLSQLNVCILGDDVSEKKPSPMIYNEARERIGIDKERCVVVEDSMVGLRAAKAAGMKCVITYTASTAGEDFYGEGADAKVPELGSCKVTLESIFGPLREKGLNAELLYGIKDSLTVKVN
jgi:HAD superfamily hydrolase (TIGR01509 family)